MKAFTYEGLKAVESDKGIEISKDGYTLATIEPLTVNSYGAPRFKVVSHVVQGLPRLAKTYRKSGASQLVEWYGTPAALADTVITSLLASDWNA